MPPTTSFEFGDLVLEAGLLAPGAAKPIPLTLEKTLLRKLGRLETADCTALEATLHAILSAT